MTERQHGHTDNYAGVSRNSNKSREWLAGWDEAQQQRLHCDREIRMAVNELCVHEWAILEQPRG